MPASPLPAGREGAAPAPLCRRCPFARSERLSGLGGYFWAEGGSAGPGGPGEPAAAGRPYQKKKKKGGGFERFIRPRRGGGREDGAGLGSRPGPAGGRSGGERRAGRCSPPLLPWATGGTAPHKEQAAAGGAGAWFGSSSERRDEHPVGQRRIDRSVN